MKLITIIALLLSTTVLANELPPVSSTYHILTQVNGQTKLEVNSPNWNIDTMVDLTPFQFTFPGDYDSASIEHTGVAIYTAKYDGFEVRLTIGQPDFFLSANGHANWSGTIDDPSAVKRFVKHFNRGTYFHPFDKTQGTTKAAQIGEGAVALEVIRKYGEGKPQWEQNFFAAFEHAIH